MYVKYLLVHVSCLAHVCLCIWLLNPRGCPVIVTTPQLAKKSIALDPSTRIRVHVSICSARIDSFLFISLRVGVPVLLNRGGLRSDSALSEVIPVGDLCTRSDRGGDRRDCVGG